jgi:ADP-ribose diphosphatase
MTTKKVLPQITARKQVAKSRLFSIEQVGLTFTNGEKREYERMSGKGRGAVMIVPMLDQQTMLLVREYCGGTHTYELGFPKGLIDAGESAAEAANRELKEEVGYGAQTLTSIHTVAIAENLYTEKLLGDEPEALELIPWPLANYRQLMQEPDFNEARSIAALLLVKDHLGSVL